MAKEKKPKKKAVKTASEKRKPIGSMVKNNDSAQTILDFYEHKKLKPADFLSSLAKNKTGGINSGENNTAKKKVLENIDVLDKDFSRTLALVHKSRTHLNGKFKLGCARLAEEIVVQHLNKNRFRVVSSGTNPLEIFEELCRSVSKEIKKKSTQKKALNIIAVAFLWLNQLEELEFKAGVDELENFISQDNGKAKNNMLQWGVDEKAIEVLTRPPITLKNLENYFVFLKSWKKEINKSNNRLNQIKDELDDEKSKSNELLGKMENLEEKLRNLQEEASREKEIFKRKEDQLEGKIVNLKCDVDNIKTKAGSILSGKIKSSLEQVRDALELDPPNLRVLNQEIEYISKTIEEEIVWLRSLD